MTRPSVIYYVQEGRSGPVKIGISALGCPFKYRVSSIQVGNPRVVRLLATEPGDKALERARHAEFGPPIRGEWFRPTPELMTHIRLVALRMPL
jgi:hypothetical protein